MKKSILTLTLGGFGIGMTEFVIMGILPDIARSLEITIPEAGHLVSAYALGVVVGAPLLIGFTGGKPPKTILLLLMILFTVFNTISAFAPSYYMLLLSRFFSGMPHGAFFGVGAVVAGRLAEPGKEARSVSLMFAGLTIANLIGVPLGTFIGHHISWRITFMIVGVIGLLTTTSIKIWMPSLAVTNTKGLLSELKFFTRLDAWLIVAVIAVGTGGFFCWYSYIAPLLTEVAGFSDDSIMYILVLAGLGMVIGNFIGGRLADRYSPLNTSAALLFAMAISLTILYFVSHNQALTLISTFITGAIAFAMLSPLQMLMINTAKGAEMLAASVSQASFNIGNALGAYLGGLPIAAGLGFNSPEWVGASLAIGGVLVSFVLMFHLKQNKEVRLQAVEA
ncbi:MFS transporter AraJ [Dyadobacter frigoris]|uniref:MFS transporter n=1 Tax=Dyadobacter frigoris TaxID=2576211 RepID=UPI0024A5FF98|nr:MFS transporter [Dyadobacter frigoris]GLU54626.1 MFS transporter AraJ [Dyadobacter frigoris]